MLELAKARVIVVCCTPTPSYQKANGRTKLFVWFLATHTSCTAGNVGPGSAGLLQSAKPGRTNKYFDPLTGCEGAGRLDERPVSSTNFGSCGNAGELIELGLCGSTSVSLKNVSVWHANTQTRAGKQTYQAHASARYLVHDDMFVCAGCGETVKRETVKSETVEIDGFAAEL